MKCCLPGTLIRDSVLKIFTGVWSYRPPCLKHTKIQDSKKSSVQHKTIYAQWATLNSSENVRTPLKIHIPRLQVRANVASRLSKSKSLRHVTLTLFCTIVYFHFCPLSLYAIIVRYFIYINVINLHQMSQVSFREFFKNKEKICIYNSCSYHF